MQYRNPLPMGTAAAAGQSTDAMKLQMAKAYGSQGGRRSAAKRGRKKASKKATKRRSSARKPKFGTPAWRKKYMGKKRRK